MKPIRNFDMAIQRAEHFLSLYDMLTNSRSRRPKSSWVKKFKAFMIWPSSTTLMRIDGKDSLLILRNPVAGLTYDKFEHDFVSEQLRSSIVAAVSAMDKYMHDHAVDGTYKLLTGPEKNIPNKLRQFELPAFEAFKAMQKIRTNPASRPGSQLKVALQAKLHKSTFQGASDIDQCMALISVKKFWSRVATELGGDWNSENLKKEINKVVRRRNYIVHEADIERKISGTTPKFRGISRKESAVAVSLVKDFVNAAELVLSPA